MKSVNGITKKTKWNLTTQPIARVYEKIKEIWTCPANIYSSYYDPVNGLIVNTPHPFQTTMEIQNQEAKNNEQLMMEQLVDLDFEISDPTVFEMDLNPPYKENETLEVNTVTTTTKITNTTRVISKKIETDFKPTTKNYMELVRGLIIIDGSNDVEDEQINDFLIERAKSLISAARKSKNDQAISLIPLFEIILGYMDDFEKITKVYCELREDVKKSPFFEIFFKTITFRAFYFISYHENKKSVEQIEEESNLTIRETLGQFNTIVDRLSKE